MISTDGCSEIIAPRTHGKKLGEKKRKINVRTTTHTKKRKVPVPDSEQPTPWTTSLNGHAISHIHTGDKPLLSRILFSKTFCIMYIGYLCFTIAQMTVKWGVYRSWCWEPFGVGAISFTVICSMMKSILSEEKPIFYLYNVYWILVFHHSANDCEMRRVPFLMLGALRGRGDKFHSHLFYGEKYTFWREAYLLLV